MIPVIFGCAGTSLSTAEKSFFSKVKPSGFILFSRNIEDPAQLSALISDLKKSVGRTKVPILVDQEGGRVQRLAAPHWRQYPPMNIFGDMAQKDPTLAASALRLNCRLIADDLRRVGINVNCLPVLDVPVDAADPIIGDRAFSRDPNLVGALGRIVVESFVSAGVLPVVKHLPGHGRAKVDSHLSLPVVDTPLAELVSSDFMPFKVLKDAPFGMTAHITYTNIDPAHPATLSRKVIGRIIRMMIQFSGLLMTDDLSMKALSGDLGTLACNALQAGCDLVLHCNGDMEEMKAVAKAVPATPEGFEKKLAHLISKADKAPMADRADIRARYLALMEKF